MKGDFSRWTYDPTKRYSRVLSLQGRVFLDADFNEAMELQLQYLRSLTANLIGPHAGVGDESFKIQSTGSAPRDFFITRGTYYVNGVPCDNPSLPPPAGGGAADPGPRYSGQPYWSDPPALDDAGSYVVYLDVWERFLTYIEDEDRTDDELQQTIREVALGGPDTAARSRIVWQVRVVPLGDVDADSLEDDADGFENFLDVLKKNNVIRAVEPDGDTRLYGKLAARARKTQADDQPCSTNPESRYRGPENQLYRVEIHDPGAFTLDEASEATFKWSRENGSVVFAIRALEGPTVTLETLGRDERLGLKAGDYVEVVDDDYVLEGRAEPLLRVSSVDPETFTVMLSAPPASNVGTDQKKHPILRRWEGTASVSVNEKPGSEGYLALEDGVEVLFSEGDYRTADYWSFPARTATGDVEWPGPAGSPKEIPPHGIVHAYAPLSVITVPAVAGAVTAGNDLRRKINKLWSAV
jgi:hypothetical protein